MKTLEKLFYVAGGFGIGVGTQLLITSKSENKTLTDTYKAEAELMGKLYLGAGIAALLVGILGFKNGKS